MDKKLKEKATRLYKTYGITLEEWEGMVKNGCEICGTREGRICCDHIHIAGFKKMLPEEKKQYVRGALCFLCNTAIGKLERLKDPVKNRLRLIGIVKYFTKYKIKGEQ